MTDFYDITQKQVDVLRTSWSNPENFMLVGEELILSKVKEALRNKQVSLLHNLFTEAPQAEDAVQSFFTSYASLAYTNISIDSVSRCVDMVVMDFNRALDDAMQNQCKTEHTPLNVHGLLALKPKSLFVSRMALTDLILEPDVFADPNTDRETALTGLMGTSNDGVEIRCVPSYHVAVEPLRDGDILAVPHGGTFSFGPFRCESYTKFSASSHLQGWRFSGSVLLSVPLMKLGRVS